MQDPPAYIPVTPRDASPYKPLLYRYGYGQPRHPRVFRVTWEEGKTAGQVHIMAMCRAEALRAFGFIMKERLNHPNFTHSKPLNVTPEDKYLWTYLPPTYELMDEVVRLSRLANKCPECSKQMPSHYIPPDKRIRTDDVKWPYVPKPQFIQTPLSEPPPR